jgi:hypothetical protein
MHTESVVHPIADSIGIQQVSPHGKMSSSPFSIACWPCSEHFFSHVSVSASSSAVAGHRDFL